MSQDSPIIPPTPQEWRLCTRAILEALAQATPITGGLATIYRYTHPSQLDQDIDRWRNDVSERINDHSAAIATLSAILMPKLRITEQAVALGVWIAQTSPTGMEHPEIRIDNLEGAFIDMPHNDLIEAVVELEQLNMLDVYRNNSGVRFVRPLPKLFVTFDGSVHGFDTVADAVHLAKLLLAKPDLANPVIRLENEADLPRRRLNPAISMLLPMIIPGLIHKNSQEITHPTSSFFIEETARFRFRRFIEEHGTPS